ncbi:MAG: hypothetical protein H7843_14190 [Nitrospirota bacterium]
MRLTMREKQTITKATAERYQKASKKRKGAILNEFVEWGMTDVTPVIY